MIVAGGQGTRLQPLTLTTPKPLLPLAGRPFLFGVIERLAAAGVDRVFLVVGAQPRPFRILEEPAAGLGVRLELVPEPEPLGTAGGVRGVIDRVRGDVLVLNGDILTDIDFTALLAAHHAARADATLALTRVADTSSFGVCVRDGTRITRFVEKPAAGSLPGHDTVNAGTYVLAPDVLARFPKGRLSFERTVFPGILEHGGHIEGFVWDGTWADLGTPNRYLEGHRLVLSGQMDWPSVVELADRGEGVRIDPGAVVHPDAILSGPCLVAKGATVAADATIGPMAMVGAGARIGPNTQVRNCVLFDEVTLAGGLVAQGLIAGTGARVAPEVVLGRDVVLADHVAVAAGATIADGARVVRI